MSRCLAWLPALPPLVTLLLVLAACGGGGTGNPGDDEPSAPTVPFGLQARVPLDPLGFPIGQPDPSPVDAERAFPGLGFSRPVFLTSAPDGSSWIYVVEQSGRILVFPNHDAVPSASTFLDIRLRVNRGGNEEGLLGLAFDPDYGPTGGTFYVHYSASGPRRSVIARYTASFANGATPRATASSGQIVLQVGQPNSNHNGGMLAFGPDDDMLYVALGDGGGGNDPDDNGQDRDTLLGSMLRIDVRGEATYRIPTDNPFVSTPGAQGEIWAYGLRNPWRFSFDRETGDLWVGDVGQGAREEIAVVAKGENHGWPVFEGNRSNRNPGGLPATAFTAPVRDYTRSEGTSVIGGYVYRGQDVPSLRGSYVYGDHGAGRVWALVRSGGAVVGHAEIQRVGQLCSFGEDERGELYAVSLGGTIWRFVEPAGGGSPTEIPETLSDTGLFSDTSSLVPNRGLVEYDVNSPLWSDGTLKRRWLGLPGTSRIGFRATRAWDFPVGTVLVKHFEIEIRPGDPTSRRRLETRVLQHAADGWRGLTYRWNPAGTDADLLAGGFSEILEIEDPTAPGGLREQRYDYPSRTDCLRCHTEAAGVVLGPRTRQLNRDFEYPRVTDNQLRSWNHVGLFDRDIGNANSYGAAVDPADDTASIDDRARSYLDANCAFCHQPGAPAPGSLDFRATTAEAEMDLFDVRPTEGDLGLPDAWRARAGASASSVLWERVRRTDEHRMPPVSSHVVDEEGVDLLGAWIDGR